MASAPLNWLLKIGGETLKTTAKTLSEAVNTLHDSVTSLSTTVTNLGTTVTNLGTSKADASTTTTALNNLETSKLNVSDLLSLEEIEASTSLTGKGVTAESVKSLNNSLVANSNHFYFDYKNGKYGFNTDSSRGADTFVPFKNGGISEFTFNSTSSFSAEIGAKYDIICATAYYQNAKGTLQGATIINEYCEYNLANVGYLYCAEIEATQNVVNFAGVSRIGLGYLKK